MSAACCVVSVMCWFLPQAAAWPRMAREEAPACRTPAPPDRLAGTIARAGSWQTAWMAASAASAAARRCGASKTGPLLRRRRPLHRRRRRCAGQTHHVSSCARRMPHARIVSIDAAAALAMPGVLAVITGADLAKAGREAAGVAPAVQAPGRLAAAPRRRAHARAWAMCASSAKRWSRWSPRRSAAARDARRGDHGRLRGTARGDRHGRRHRGRRAEGLAGGDRQLRRARCSYGDAAAVAMRPSPRAAHVVTLDLVNQRLAPTPLEPRVDARQLRRRERPHHLAHEQPDARPARATRCATKCWAARPRSCACVVGDVGGGFGMKTGAYPEDIVVAYCRAAAEAAGEMGGDAACDEFLAAHARPRCRAATPNWRSTPTARCWASACGPWPMSAPMPRMAGIIIQLLIGPWVCTSIYDIGTIDFALHGGADATPRPPAPIAAPAGPRRSTSSSG